VCSARKLISSFLIIIYFLLINGELISLAEYYIRYDYIVKNLCVQKDRVDNTCKGSCHLKQNLDKVDETSKDFPKSVELRNFIFIDHHLISNNKNLYDYFNFIFCSLFFDEIDKNQINLEVQTPPPKSENIQKYNPEIQTALLNQTIKISEENNEKNYFYFTSSYGKS